MYRNRTPFFRYSGQTGRLNFLISCDFWNLANSIGGTGHHRKYTTSQGSSSRTHARTESILSRKSIVESEETCVKHFRSLLPTRLRSVPVLNLCQSWWIGYPDTVIIHDSDLNPSERFIKIEGFWMDLDQLSKNVAQKNLEKSVDFKWNSWILAEFVYFEECFIKKILGELCILDGIFGILYGTLDKTESWVNYDLKGICDFFMELVGMDFIDFDRVLNEWFFEMKFVDFWWFWGML